MYDLGPGYGQWIEEIKTSGFYMRRADHVILRNCQVKFERTEKHDFSHALYVEECRDMTLKNFRGQVSRSSLDNVVIRQDES
ncbi:MAG: hypothetical protein LUK37_22105 [Clostridia bacterium]|nr:hypothetical protein [Clostridia bacterium]